MQLLLQLSLRFSTAPKVFPSPLFHIYNNQNRQSAKVEIMLVLKQLCKNSKVASYNSNSIHPYIIPQQMNSALKKLPHFQAKRRTPISRGFQLIGKNNFRKNFIYFPHTRLSRCSKNHGKARVVNGPIFKKNFITQLHTKSTFHFLILFNLYFAFLYSKVLYFESAILSSYLLKYKPFQIIFYKKFKKKFYTDSKEQ